MPVFYDAAPYGGAVPADPLGRRCHHHRSPVLDGPEQITARAEGIVHDERQVMVLGDRCNAFKIRHYKARIADGFHINGLGIGINEALVIAGLLALSKARFDAEAFESHFELIVGAAVEVGRSDEIVAGL